MGIDYKAAVWVGLPRSDLDSDLDIEDAGLEICPPYYDGYSADYAIVGFEVQSTGRYSPEELALDDSRIAELKGVFKEVTGLDAKIWLSPYGY